MYTEMGVVVGGEQGTHHSNLHVRNLTYYTHKNYPKTTIHLTL